jgi:hypothetical protein
MAALVYETRTRLGLMPVDRARKGYEEAGTYRVVVGFYPTYSPDGKRT